MAQNVKFFFTSDIKKYQNLATKDPMALYFIEDAATGFCGLYKGDHLIAVGSDATSMSAGLMSSADKKSLDELIASGGGLNNLQAVDGSLSITDGANGKKNIGVVISSEAGNILSLKGDGLYVETASSIDVPEYTIEKQAIADEGFNATYRLKKTVGTESSYVGDSINVAIDAVLSSAEFKVVEEADMPYEGAVVGEPYIELGFNNATKTHLYIPMKSLVDQYKPGYGLQLVDGTFSVNLAPTANGLQFVDGALSLALATKDAAGALSAVDKAFIDSIPEIYAPKEFVRKTTMQVKYEFTDTPEGTLVNYGEREIRIMCPANAQWTKQNVGAGGDANSYYGTLKTYAPNDDSIVGYVEHLGGQSDSEILTDLKTDEFGRKYQPTWLALAKYDEATAQWSYHGDKSSAEKYIGWDYRIDWYNADGVMVASDSIRINLSNADCHYNNTPYYMTNFATKEDVSSVSEAYTWGEL